MAPGIKPLVLAGGRSTRMGTPKHLLELPDGTPLYQHQINTLRQACPSAVTVYISLAKDSPLDALLASPPDPGLQIILDEETNDTARSGGPSQGLLSAFASDPTATWLVLAVDYPLMTTRALAQLRDAYEPPVTCFRNDQGFCEPLVGIWGPEALRLLRAKGTRSSPSAVVKELKGRQLSPAAEVTQLWANVNEWPEWERVCQLLQRV
ncbi:nucleotide-diphospho-sugar transferase [Coniochaeta ligniaria NRRL 30616]|uniref:Nucleotide-diphospho-sugar transferase n=1 Tax=Coniochaeta ligniaria NRRL 30616 TaxID=1408157 RepID=A0A1J7IQW7_9PEZI|nr:nucleotide-diphospho-sugar transferase [Coniochaeta ligniaria NRRL 30616]